MTSTTPWCIGAVLAVAVALTGCTARPELTEDSVSADGSLAATDGTSQAVRGVSGATSFDPANPSVVDVWFKSPTSDGRFIQVEIKSNIKLGTAANADLSALGAQECWCVNDPSIAGSCESSTVCAPAEGTLTGSYDDTDASGNLRLHQLVGTLVLTSSSGFAGRIELVHHEDWTYSADAASSDGGNAWDPSGWPNVGAP